MKRLLVAVTLLSCIAVLLSACAIYEVPPPPPRYVAYAPPPAVVYVEPYRHHRHW